MADTLRRQTDDFIDVVDLRDLIARPPREYAEDRHEPHAFHEVVRLKSLMTAASGRNNEPRSAFAQHPAGSAAAGEFLDEARDKNPDWHNAPVNGYGPSMHRSCWLVLHRACAGPIGPALYRRFCR